MGFWLGVALLALCGLGMPVYRKVAHTAMLKNLGWDGASLIPVTWGLSGLRLKRARWEGEVEFEPSGIGGGGRRGHLRLVASLGRKTPALWFSDARRGGAAGGEPSIPTGDAAFDARVAVQGDAELARKLLGPDQRRRLLGLLELGGSLRAVSGGVVDLVGPLPADGADLRRFLDGCDAILDAMAGGLTP